jgi:multidrug efflux pump subunit AcrB
MKPFIRFFAERHALAYVITLTIILFGSSALLSIKRDVLPNVNLEEMEIITAYPGGAAEDVELNVTTKIEDELKEVDGIDSVVSVSLENQSNIHVNIDRGVRDTEKVKRDVRNAIDRIVDFPQEVTDAPRIIEISTDLFPVIEVSVISDELSYGELRNIAKDLKQKLLDLPSVSSVRANGLLDREVKIQVNSEKAEEFYVTPQDVFNAIKSRNIRASAGTLESYTAEKSVITLAEFESPMDVGDVVVRSTFGGPAVYVKDVAEIVDGFKEETERARVNGNSAITFEVLKKASADIIKTADSVKDLAQKENERHKGEVIVITSGDRSKVVRNRLSVVFNNGLIGLSFVLIMLIILLNFRVAFWTALGIPIALLGAIFFLPVFDMTLSAIAMAGLIIVIGIVVDDAIVVSENITRHSEMGKSAIDAAVDGVEEVFKPVITTIITTILAFSPMFFIDGVLGDFVFVIPLVVCIALAVSFLESIFALPSHLISGFSGRTSSITSSVKKESAWFKNYLVIPFSGIVKFSLKNRYSVILFFILLLAGTLYFAKNHIDFILFPTDSSDEVQVLVELPTGSSMDATVDKIKEVEEALLSLPKEELDSFVVRVGRVGVNNLFRTSNNAVIIMYLTPYSTRDRGAREIVKELKEKTESIDGATVAYQISAGGPPVGKPIALRVTGDNDVIRNALVNDIVSKLEKMEAVSGIDADNKKGKQQVEVKLNYEKLSELGLNVSAVAQSLRLAFDGEVATSVRYGDDDVDFRVQLDSTSKEDVESFSSFKIPNAQGRLIRLNEIASFEQADSLSILSHYQNKRSTMITADVDIDMMTPIEATQEILSQVDIEEWPGMVVFSDGEADESQDSVGSLGTAFSIAMVSILLVLVLLFSSIIKPLIVLSVIPFGLIGVVWAFVFHGEPVSFIASIGVIGLTGVLVNDSLILVSYVDNVKRAHPDLSYLEAVTKAASTRFRPILITSLTTVSGLIPLAYGFGGADPLMAPMALAMGYGVTMATPLALILIPCFLLVYEDIKNIFRKLFSLIGLNKKINNNVGAS